MVKKLLISVLFIAFVVQVFGGQEVFAENLENESYGVKDDYLVQELLAQSEGKVTSIDILKTDSYGNKLLDVDGQLISYNEQAVNGGIDLTSPIYSLNDKTTLMKMNGDLELQSTKRSVVISLPFQTQINNYYCGPAAARMVVGAIGYSRTQQQMASLLGTTTNGTNAGASVANALNRVVSGSKYKFYWEWHTYDQISKIKSHIVQALSYGNPVMVNTAEGPGDVYLVGHNTGAPLYHYGVVADYFDYGNQVTYTDPGAGRFKGFVVDQRATIKNISYATGTRGYVW